jgi:hypothetical protein
MEIDGRKCREYDLAIRGDNINEKHREKACQSGEGTWQPM